MSPNAIEARGLVKHFGETLAVDDVDLDVTEGSVVGLLGPNGAGKTTTVRILATLLAPDEGRAQVFGYDVRQQPEKVRALIGLTGQYAALDDNLTGRENIVMIGQLYQLPTGVARRRAGELLERFDLVDAADRQVKTYSGGMTRRLDLAASLVGHPRVLFLDEPTTGLDPRSRRGMWEIIRELVEEGTTLLLTTQYLEEADLLADRIVLIDRGAIIAEGTANELKRGVGGQLLEFHLATREDADRTAALVTDLAQGEVQFREEVGEHRVLLPVGQKISILGEAVQRLDKAEIHLIDVSLHKPTLDDVFFALTGASPDEPRSRARSERDRQGLDLSNIEGIGPATEKALLDRFGSVDAVLRASHDELVEVDRVGPTTARRIEAAARGTQTEDVA